MGSGIAPFPVRKKLLKNCPKTVFLVKNFVKKFRLGFWKISTVSVTLAGGFPWLRFLKPSLMKTMFAAAFIENQCVNTITQLSTSQWKMKSKKIRKSIRPFEFGQTNVALRETIHTKSHWAMDKFRSSPPNLPAPIGCFVRKLVVLTF